MRVRVESKSVCERGREREEQVMEEEQGADSELERRSKFLSNLIQNQRKKANQSTQQQQQQQQQKRQQQQQLQPAEILKVRVRACDMSPPLQNKAFHCARHTLDSMPPNKLDTKRLALALKKVWSPPFLLSLFYTNLIFFICHPL